jgi:uncharacterized membrane protein
MKARLRTILLSALGVIAAFSAVTYTSCNEDKCKAIVCANNGICKDGTCFCLAGFEGTQCETVTRERYKGTWVVFEKGTLTNPATYDVTVDYGSTMTEVVIRNFYNKFTQPLRADIKGDSLTIPLQNIDGYEIAGRGYIKKSLYYGENGEMVMRYTVKDPEGRTNDYGVNIGEPSIWNR